MAQLGSEKNPLALPSLAAVQVDFMRRKHLSNLILMSKLICWNVYPPLMAW